MPAVAQEQRDVADTVMAELRALKASQEEYARKTNKELARLRRGEKPSSNDAESYATEVAQASPSLNDWQSMRELARLEQSVSGDVAAILARESEGKSLAETLAMYRLAEKLGPKNSAEPQQAPAFNRGPAPQQPPSRLVQHPKSLHQYQRLSAEARKSLDRDDSFDPSFLPRFVPGDR